MSNRKPLSILDILKKPIQHEALMRARVQNNAKIRRIEVDLGITEETDIRKLPDEVQNEVLNYMKQNRMLEEFQRQFNKEYKNSIKRLIDVKKELPIHINSWDIHDHNVDVENLVSIYKGVINDKIDSDDELGSMLDLFTDKSTPAFATAPYNFQIVQLQSPKTYTNTVGKVMDDEILRMMRKKTVSEDYGIHTQKEYEEFVNLYTEGEETRGGKNQEVVAIVQQYAVDEYIEYLHLWNKSVFDSAFKGGFESDWDKNWFGHNVKDTILGSDINLSRIVNHSEIPEAEHKEGNEYFIDPINEVRGLTDNGDFMFIQVVDILNYVDDELFYESSIVGFLDNNGQPTLSSRYDGFKSSTFEEYDENPFSNVSEERYAELIESIDTGISGAGLTHSDSFLLTAIHKVFQWWNSDNDLLEVADLPLTPSVRKRLKKYNKKNSSDRTITYKTLQVRPSIKVVDDTGEERTPLIKEIAQHTRRGHWAHYGINGKGKLFGKYTKSVYRKPKTIGKLENGLVLKDYELLENESGE